MSNSEEADARNDAVENVKERAESWDPGAEPETVEQHLREGFEQAGAFGVGPTDTEITSIDADGVALAAIQGLHTLLQEKDAQIEE